MATTTSIYNKLHSAMDAASLLWEEVTKEEDTFPKGEDFRGTNDALIVAAQYLLRAAANRAVGDNDVSRYQYQSAKVLLELVDCDKSIS